MRRLVWAFVALHQCLVLLGVLALVFGVMPAQAQSGCRNWATFTTPAFSFDGTMADACSAYAGFYATHNPTRAPVTVASCVAGSGLVEVTLNLSSPTETTLAHVADAGAGTCSSDPPDPPEPTASSVEFTQGQSLNLLAYGFLVLICGIGFIGGRLR